MWVCKSCEEWSILCFSPMHRLIDVVHILSVWWVNGSAGVSPRGRKTTSSIWPSTLPSRTSLNWPGLVTTASTPASHRWQSWFSWACIISIFNQVFNGCSGVNIWFPLNNFSLLWPIDTKLAVLVAYIKRQLGIATQVSVIKVKVTVTKSRNSVSAQ